MSDTEDVGADEDESGSGDFLDCFASTGNYR